MMVKRASATNFGPNEKLYDQLSIEANHSDIVKFSDPSDTAYSTIESRTKALVAAAPTVIKERFANYRKSECLDWKVRRCTLRDQLRVIALGSPIH
jgi:hypothetical protein